MLYRFLLLTLVAIGTHGFSSPTRKPGVLPPPELKVFVEAAQDKLVVVDVREPSEATEVGPIPGDGVRPQAINLSWDREAGNMPLPDVEQVPFETPIITHCGGGGRGQKACDFLKEVSTYYYAIC
mmetsp:Transcript_27699/g.76218  ORF Transcript_27699/g.76218 Transcript_27699/m.76218 type:complete len:125 (+) Transcript_27699:82-456(+)